MQGIRIGVCLVALLHSPLWGMEYRYVVDISQEKVVHKVCAYLDRELPHMTEEQLVEYIGELQSFIPWYTMHTWDDVRPKLLDTINENIVHHKKYIGYPIDLEAIRAGTLLTTIGLIAGVIACSLRNLAAAAIKDEKESLEKQYKIRVKVEHVSSKHTITTYYSDVRNRPKPEVAAALNYYKKLYENPMGVLYGVPFVVSFCTAMFALPIGLLMTVFGLANPQHKTRYEKLCFFKNLLDETHQYDTNKCHEPTHEPKIVDWDFFAREN